MRIQTVFLDIGMVLVGLDFRPAFQEVSRLSGLSREEIQRRLAGYRDIVEYEKGRLSTAEFFQRLSRLLEIDVSLEQFRSIWHSVLVWTDDKAVDLVSEELFHRLKRRYRLIALSNTNEMQFDYLSRTHPLIPELDDCILSYRMGCMKPGARIYERALEVAGCPAEQALFIDDLEENIEAARRLGMRGIVFQGEEKLREELAELGVTA